MVQVVYEFVREGDWEISARELLNRFVAGEGFGDAEIHNPPGAVTIILVDDPCPELVERLRADGWSGRPVWTRSEPGPPVEP